MDRKLWKIRALDFGKVCELVLQIWLALPVVAVEGGQNAVASFSAIADSARISGYHRYVKRELKKMYSNFFMVVFLFNNKFYYY